MAGEVTSEVKLFDNSDRNRIQLMLHTSEEAMELAKS